MSNAQELQEQGIKLYHQHDYEAAARLFQQAQERYIEQGEPDMAAEMKTNIGLVHRALGEYQQALDIMQEALLTFQEQGDRFRVAQVLGNLGGVYTELGDKEQAHNSYRQAADIFLELDKKEHYGKTLTAIGALQVRDGKLWTGAATYEVGLDNLNKLSATQKILKGLLGIRNKLTGQ